MSALTKLDLLLNVLDEKSRKMTMFLLNESHAELRDLSNLLCASSDMEVLLIIREIINPTAKEIIGKPILSFQQSKIDRLTGQKIMFSWWVDEDFASKVRAEELIDVIEEENLVRVIAALPSTEKFVQLRLTESCLIISGKEYYKEVHLPCSVIGKIEKNLHNSVLEVKLSTKEESHANRN
ncbi:MAG: hypothetical protein ACLQO7_09395 [Candidatus Bathyarchaeia archaeon]